MKITRIAKLKKGNRYAIYLDSTYSFSVQQDTLIKEHLYSGQELDEGQIAEIKEKDNFQYLFEKSLGQLARRPRSVSEIKRYLTNIITKYNSDSNLGVIALVIKQLEAKNYINDEEFAQWFINNRKDFKQRSKNELRKELSLKGIHKDIIERRLADQVSEAEELKNIAELIAKKSLYFKMRSSDTKQFREKISSYLLRKGYSWD